MKKPWIMLLIIAGCVAVYYYFFRKKSTAVYPLMPAPGTTPTTQQPTTATPTSHPVTVARYPKGSKYTPVNPAAKTKAVPIKTTES